MIEVDVQVPSKIKTEQMIHLIEQSCRQHDLTCSLKGTLTSYPGCVHWHFKREKQTGTLEITWWEKEERLWFKVGSHRSAVWIEEAIPHLKKKMEASLSKNKVQLNELDFIFIFVFQLCLWQVWLLLLSSSLWKKL